MRRARCRTSSSPIRRCSRCVATTYGARRARASARKDSFWQRPRLPHRSRRRHPVHRAGSGAVNAGYFQNVGHTRRQGLELGAGAPFGAVRADRALQLHRRDVPDRIRRSSPNNSTADADGTSRAARRLAARNSAPPAQAARPLDDRPGARARRDDGRRQQPVRARQREQSRSGRRRARLRSSSNLDARWDRRPALADLRATSTNLFNTRYQNFGMLGVNYFRGPGNTFDARARGAGSVPLAGDGIRRVDRGPVQFRRAARLDVENGHARVPTEIHACRRAAARSNGSLPQSIGALLPAARAAAPTVPVDLCATPDTASTCRCTCPGNAG